jgi:hypothetical protein
MPPSDALMEPLHPADIADLLEQVSADERGGSSALEKEIDGEILSELDEGLREEVIAALCRPARWPRRCASSIPTTSSTWSRISRAAAAGDPRRARDRDRDRGAAGADLSGILRRPPDAARGGDGARALDRGRAIDYLRASTGPTCPSSSTT